MAMYTKACDMKYGLGCTNVGDLYKDGKGVPRDLEKAKPYYEKGCSLGDNEDENGDDACDRLKQLY